MRKDTSVGKAFLISVEKFCEISRFAARSIDW